MLRCNGSKVLDESCYTFYPWPLRRGGSFEKKTSEESRVQRSAEMDVDINSNINTDVQDGPEHVIGYDEYGFAVFDGEHKPEAERCHRYSRCVFTFFSSSLHHNI